jgi:hypothetical protein
MTTKLSRVKNVQTELTFIWRDTQAHASSLVSIACDSLVEAIERALNHGRICISNALWGSLACDHEGMSSYLVSAVDVYVLLSVAYSVDHGHALVELPWTNLAF